MTGATDPYDGTPTEPLRVESDPRPPSERTRPRQRVVTPPSDASPYGVPPPFAPAPPPPLSPTTPATPAMYGALPPSPPGPPRRRPRWPWAVAAAVVLALGVGVGTVAVLDPFGDADSGAAVGGTERDRGDDGGNDRAEDVPFGTSPATVRAEWATEVSADGWSPTFEGDGVAQWSTDADTVFSVYALDAGANGSSGDDARRTQDHLHVFEDALYEDDLVTELVVAPTEEVTIATTDGGAVAALQQEAVYTTAEGTYFSRYVARALADGTLVGYQLVTPTSTFDETTWADVTAGLALELVTA